MNCNFVYIESVESTNSYAQKHIAKCNPNEITVIYTFNQSNGRGQIGRNWYSGSNLDISMSIIYFPKRLLATESFDLLIRVSLSLSMAIEEVIGIKCKIKWPNDIYYLNHKLAGILIQNSISEKSVLHSIIGIGLNVNSLEFPDELPNPISLTQILNKSFDLDQLTRNLCINMLSRLEHDCNTKGNYEERLYRRDKWAPYRVKSGEIFDGKILATDPSGCLMIEKRSGIIEKYNMHEITFVI